MTKLIKLIIVTWNKLILQSACGDETDHDGKDDDQVKDRDEDETDQALIRLTTMIKSSQRSR